MQQNPSYGENLRNWYSYFSLLMDAVFPLDSHFMLNFITWKMHVFSDQFPITREKTAKLIECIKHRKLVLGNILQNPFYVENLGNWYLHFSHSMVALDFHPMVYFIAWKMHRFSHRFPIAWGKA